MNEKMEISAEKEKLQKELRVLQLKNKVSGKIYWMRLMEH